MLHGTRSNEMLQVETTMFALTRYSFMKQTVQRASGNKTFLKSAGRRVLKTMKRYPSQPTSLLERSMFVSMWISGKSARTIARETGVSPATVCRWINRWKQEGNVENYQHLKNIHQLLCNNLYLEGIMSSNCEAFLHF